MNLNDKKSNDNNRKIVVNKNMKDHGNDPFFVKKAEASKKVIEKYGIPEKLVTNQK